jgi:hypothetical protein
MDIEQTRAPEGVEPKPTPEVAEAPPRSHTSAAQLAERSGRAGRARAEREAREAELLAEEQVEHVAPDQIVEHLDKAAEARDAGEPVESVTIETPLSKDLQPHAERYVEEISKLASETHMPVGEVNLLFNFALNNAVEMLAKDEGSLEQGQQRGPNLADRQQCETTIRRKYGAMSDAIIAQSAEGFKKLPLKWQQYLDTPAADGSLLTNHPGIVAALWLWNSGYSRLSKESAQKELTHLRESKQYMQRDAITLDKARMLTAIIAQGKSGDNKALLAAAAAKKAPKAVQKTQHERLEAELRSIRQDPGYYQRDAGNHKALVDRVNAIYAELHGGK